MSTTSPSDAQLLADFLKFLREHPEMVKNFGGSLPGVWYILVSCSALLVRPVSNIGLGRVPGGAHGTSTDLGLHCHIRSGGELHIFCTQPNIGS